MAHNHTKGFVSTPIDPAGSKGSPLKPAMIPPQSQLPGTACAKSRSAVFAVADTKIVSSVKRPES